MTTNPTHDDSPSLYPPTYPRQRQPLQVGPSSIGWGILGASQRAERVIIDAIRQTPPAPGRPNEVGAWVVGVYSHNERRAQALAKAHYLPHTFLNLADLLQRREIQCVYVGSQPRHHAPLVMAALAAGKHVLCEAPIALTSAEAQDMAQAAEKRGLLLRLGHQWRADPALRQLRLLLANQTVGDLLGGRISNTTLLTAQEQSWRLRGNGGGALLHRTYADMDLLAYLFDAPVVEIAAAIIPSVLAETGQGEIEEGVMGYVRYRQGLTIQFHDAFFIPHNPTVVEFYGATGVLQLRHWARSDYPSELWLLRNDSAQPLPFATAVPEQAMLLAFTNAIRAGSALPSTDASSTLADAHAGRDALTVLAAARQSIRTKQPVILPG